MLGFGCCKFFVFSFVSAVSLVALGEFVLDLGGVGARARADEGSREVLVLRASDLIEGEEVEGDWEGE